METRSEWHTHSEQSAVWNANLQSLNEQHCKVSAVMDFGENPVDVDAREGVDLWIFQ